MTYATQADLTERFGETELTQLTDRTSPVGTLDATVLGRALADADAEMDAYLATRYALPVASVPRLLVGVACDIARYRLYDDRATDQVTKRYEDAIKLLKSIAKGDVKLGLTEAGTAAATTGGAQAFGGERVFSRSRLGDYAG